MTARRILYVIDSLAIGGAEMLLVDLVDAALQRGWRPHVAFFTPGPLEEALAARGVATTRVSRRGLRDPRAALRLLALMRRERPAVVHTHLTKSDLAGQAAARLAGVPCRVLTVHNVNPWRRRRALSLGYRLLTAGAHRRIAVSGEVAAATEASGSAPAGSLRVVENGVDMRRFDPDRAAPLALEPFGVPPGAPVVAVVGRLAPQKDHETFLRAVAALVPRLAPAARDARFLVVGAGPRREALEALARELGLGPDRVAFAGVVRDMPGLLAAVDVVAFSSAWEGLPVTLLEAMAMRRCVVSTAVGGIPGAAADGRDALLVAPGDPEALARALGRALGDPALRARLGAAARRAVAARFGGDAMLERTFALYAPDPTSDPAPRSRPDLRPPTEPRTSR